jgi:imidazolonepropionase-like amidohydrolase
MTKDRTDRDDVVAFTGARLIDGRGGAPVPDATVVVAKGRVAAAGSRADVSVPPGARTIELKGRSILPGLIDAHLHVGNIDVSMYKTAELSPAVYVHRASRNLETALDLGFTSLRDAGGLDFGFKEAIDADLIRGPRLFLSISPLTPTGGHFDMRRGRDLSVVPRNSIGICPEICDGADAVRKSARDVIRRGADQIKVAADGGVDSPSDLPGHWQFSIEEMRAAVEVAESTGRYVMAHAYAPVPIQHCLEAGVRSIEHGNLMDAETARMVADRGAFYVPTLTIYDLFAREAAGAIDEFARRKLHLVHEAGRRALEFACNANVRIGSGSDILGPYHHLIGRELSLKAVEMSPMEAIVAATRVNAEILGMQETIGTLEAGKEADLIVVDGNPLSDPLIFENGLETVLLVMKGGRVMKNLMPGLGCDQG